MTAVSASAVSSLRARTGVSMMECKKALDEAGGDEEKAIEILRKKGIAQAAKKADRSQGEGRIFGAASGGKAALVVIKCETDFVARSDDFQKAGSDLAQLVHDKGEEAAKKEGETLIPFLVQKLGENISLGDMHRFESPVIGTYVHSNGKIGVVVGLSEGSQDQARDAAMHAAALSPAYVSPADVPEDLIEKEKEIWRSQLKGEGKPEAIFDKIMVGKEKKFREESALISQPFVKDPNKTVQEYLGAAKVVEYIRVAVS